MISEVDASFLLAEYWTQGPSQASRPPETGTFAFFVYIPPLSDTPCLTPRDDPRPAQV
jgi:hypothetical protein